MDELTEIVNEITKALLEDGAASVIVIVTDPEGSIYSQWAIPHGMSLENIQTVFRKIEGTGSDYTIH